MPDAGIQDFIRRMFMNQTGGAPPVAPMSTGIPQAGPATPMAPMPPRVPGPPPVAPTTPGMPAGADAAKLFQQLLARRKQMMPGAGAAPPAIGAPPGLIGRR